MHAPQFSGMESRGGWMGGARKTNGKFSRETWLQHTQLKNDLVDEHVLMRWSHFYIKTNFYKYI